MKLEIIVDEEKNKPDDKKDDSDTIEVKHSNKYIVEGSVHNKKNKIEQLYHQLIEYVNKDFKELAETLKAIFIEGKPDAKTDLLKKYCDALVGKILLVEGHLVKFTARFIERTDLDHSEQMLWAVIFKNSSTPYAVTKNINPSKNKQLIEALKSKNQKKNTLPPTIDMKYLESVIRRFFFAVIQPNNEELKIIIVDELESRYGFSIQDKASRSCFSSLGFNKLEKMIDDSIDSANVEYLEKDRLLDELQVAENTVKNSKLDVHTEIFKGTMQNLRVEFEDLDFEKNPVDLLSKSPLAIITSTQRGWLTSIKLSQMFKEQQYRYFSFKKLKTLPTRKMLLDVLKDCSSTYLLVLRDDGSEFDIAGELMGVVPSGGILRLILLTHKRDRVPKVFSNDAIIEDRTNSFFCLTEQTRNMLDSRQIIFQSGEIPFKDLKGYSKLPSVLQNEVLEKIVLDEKLTIGANLPVMETKHYIPREMIVDQSDVYNEEQFLAKLPYFNLNNNIMVLSSIPGMGKSTLWVRLAQLAKQSNPSVWILHVKLQDCSKLLSSDTKMENLENAIEFLSTAVSCHSHLETCLLRFGMIYNEKPYIFFDGFDELPYENTKQFISLLNILYGKAQIFVNTREHRQNELDSQLKIEKFFLLPMSKEDLKKYFTSLSPIESFASFVDQLMEKMENKSMQLASKIIGTPLIAKMLIEIYIPFVKSCQLAKDISNLQENLDALSILSLFERFNYSSFRKVYVKKFKDPNDRDLSQIGIFYKAFDRLHSFLGLQNLLDLTHMKLIVSSEDNKEFHQQALQLQSPLVEYINEYPHFSHQSYAEYFAAKSLFNQLNSMMNDEVKRKFDKTGSSEDQKLRWTKWLYPSNLKSSVESNEENRKDLSTLYFQLLHDYPMVRKFFFLIVRHYSSESLLDKIEQMFNCMQTIYALLWAYEENFEELVSRLASKDPSTVNDTLESKDTALHYMASHNAVDVCTFLIKNGANVNSRNIENETPLHKAASNGSLEVVKLIINVEGVDKNPLNNYKTTPLYLACCYGHAEVVRVLLDNGCCLCRKQDTSHQETRNEPTGGIDDEDWYHLLSRVANEDVGTTIDALFEHLVQTPFEWKKTLLWAIENDNPYVIETMNKVGINVFEVDDTGDHLIHQATKKDSAKCVKFYLKNGTDGKSVNWEGLTPFDLALKFQRPNALEVLLAESKSLTLIQLDTALHLVVKTALQGIDSKCYHYVEKCIAVLLKYGASLSALDENGRTILHVALEQNKVDCVKNILPIKNKDNKGQTVLHVACAIGSAYIVEELIKRGAVINSKNNKNQTPLHVAATGGHWDIARMLLNWPGYQTAEDNQGMMHLHLAAAGGHLSYVRNCIINAPFGLWVKSDVQKVCDIAKANGHDWDAECNALLNFIVITS